MNKLKKYLDESALFTLLCVEGFVLGIGTVIGIIAGKKYKAFTMTSALVLIALSSVPLKNKIAKSIKDNY